MLSTAWSSHGSALCTGITTERGGTSAIPLWLVPRTHAGKRGSGLARVSANVFNGPSVASCGAFVPVHCVTLWIGEALGPIERACLKSVLRQGHPLSLYCYSPPAGVPEGVELRNAAEIVSEDRIIRHRSGSVSLFSNLFRYALQAKSAGTWVDCDAYLLAPLEGDSPYLVGEEAPGVVNGGVLRIPPDSPLLPPLMALFDEQYVPYWIPWRFRATARWRLFATGRTGLSKMPWGSTGPKALTALMRKHGLIHLAAPPEVLYPVRWDRAGWICDPAIRVEDVITPRTASIHLWNERIKQFKDAPAPPDSFLARLQEEGR